MRCYQHNLGYQTSLAFLSLCPCSTKLVEWCAARFGCSVGTSMVPLVTSAIDIVKTTARHLSVSALYLREVFRIRNRKVMISEIRLDVIHQRMGNYRSKSRYSVNTERVINIYKYIIFIREDRERVSLPWLVSRPCFSNTSPSASLPSFSVCSKAGLTWFCYHSLVSRYSSFSPFFYPPSSPFLSFIPFRCATAARPCWM